MSLLILATSEFIHAVLLNIVTQSLTIGECTDYFGSHDSDNRNDSGRVRMLMYGPACPCMCQHASFLYIRVVLGHGSFWKIHP